MLKRISSSIFTSRIFNFLFAHEIAQMQIKTIHDFKVKTLGEIKEAQRNRAEKAAATEIVNGAIAINKLGGQVEEDRQIQEKVRFKKKYGEAGIEVQR